MGSWSAAQSDLLREVHERASAQLEEEDLEDEGLRSADDTVVVAGRSGRGGVLASVTSLFGGNALALGLVGMIVGAGLLAGVFWGTGVIPPKTTQDTSLEGATDTSQYLASQEQRIAELQDTITLDPENVAAIEELADIYMVGQSWSDALYWFNALLQINPNNLHALLDTGTAFMNLGYYSTAEELFDKVLSLDPENVQAHYNAGFLFAFRTDAPDLTKAVEHWKEVVRLDPDSTLGQIAQLHLDQFQPDQAAP